MTPTQRTIKFLAIGLAIFLIICIISGIISTIGVLGGFIDSEAVTGNIKTYSVSDDIKALNIQISAADFTIKQGKAFSVESNLKHLTVTDDNGTLTIKEARKFGTAYTEAVLTLYIPADTEFEKVNITTGAGRFKVENLAAEKLYLKLGAGEVEIDTLVANSSADIEGGAGKVTISDGVLHDLDLEIGVGQLNLTSALSGESELDLGVGESNITLIGSRDDYKVDIDKGVGNISVEGTNISNTKGFGDGNNEVDINGGVGSISVKFKQPTTK